MKVQSICVKLLQTLEKSSWQAQDSISRTSNGQNVKFQVVWKIKKNGLTSNKDARCSARTDDNVACVNFYDRGLWNLLMQPQGWIKLAFNSFYLLQFLT
jgi:hypothetical protein